MRPDLAGTPQKNRTPDDDNRNGPGPVSDPGPPPKTETHAQGHRFTAEKEAPPVPTTVHGTADNCVVVDADVLVAAAELIAGRGDLERSAYERGVLYGFAQGWEQGLSAGLERAA